MKGKSTYSWYFGSAQQLPMDMAKQRKKKKGVLLKKIITTMHPSMWGFFLTKENPDRIRMDHFTIIDSI